MEWRAFALEAKLKPNRFFLYLLITACCVIEIALSAADLGLVWSTHLRRLVLEYGAFWPGLLGNWQPNYSAQPYTMFLTHSFLHSGPIHLTVNMITLWSLARPVLVRMGQGKFLVLYVATTLGGGAGFALFAPGLQPMVGASGALFGLLGALMACAFVHPDADNVDRRHISLTVLALAGFNLLLWWALEGQLAWQAHLGGFIVGWIAGPLIAHTPENEHTE